jgi:transposase-like protein
LVRQIWRWLRASRQSGSPKPGTIWHLDEVFVTLRGEPYLLWRAVDQHGAELDILLQKRRDKAAARRFFKRVLASCPEVPCKIVTDQLRSYPAAKAEIPELANVKHVFVKAAARLNNRAENSHQPTRERERRMRGFGDPKRTQKFLSCFGPIRQHFSRSSGICCALHFIANNSQLDSLHGAKSPTSPEIRRLLFDHLSYLPSSRLTLGKLTKPLRQVPISLAETWLSAEPARGLPVW